MEADMFELKPISRDAIPAALEKADRYRLLNQPRQAQSICLDVLRIEPAHPRALTTLVLTITDQFGRAGYQAGLDEAREVLTRIEGAYEKAYYEGIVFERWGKSLLGGRVPAHVGTAWLRKAMSCFDEARPLAPTGNDEAILHWNACARLITRFEESAAHAEPSESDGGFMDEPPG
jgi:hypothetical protein